MISIFGKPGHNKIVTTGGSENNEYTEKHPQKQLNAYHAHVYANDACDVPDVYVPAISPFYIHILPV